MPEKDQTENSNIHAEDNSIAVGGIQVGGDARGDIRIGHTIGYTSEQVSALIAQISSTFQAKPFDGRCPYKGLDVFEEEDAELFFGRERLVEDLVSRVKESRTVFVTGPSGSGKSSLVRAGLIHALKQGAVKNLHSERWLYETMKPGREPIKELALAFSRLKSPDLANYFQEHANEIDILNKCAESVLSGRKDQRFVLFIDQFEEVFTQISQEEERLTFLNVLAHAGTVENGRVIILFAMRSDFLSNCATYPQLNALLSQQFIQIGAMKPEELVSAISQPALRVGLRIDPDLVAQIINEMRGEPGALPLMQFALKDLFDSRQEKGGIIALTLGDYSDRGGIHKALERHADHAFARLSENEQELAHSIFGGLIQIGHGTQETRRIAPFDELIPASANEAEVQAVVQKLADARLITTDEKDSSKYTITHEKLIDAWPWLKKLVDENRDVIALQNEIADDAEEWEDHQRDSSYLYSGARLATAHEKIKNLALSERAQAFLKTSITIEENARQRSDRTRRWIFSGLVGFSAVVLVLLVFALFQLQISRALQLGYQAQASFLAENYYDAGLYALQSNKIYKNEIANLILGKFPYQNFILSKTLQGHTSQVYSVAWSADGRLASASLDGTVIIWNLITGKPTQTLQHIASDTYWSGSGLAWSPDGRLASPSGGNSVVVWNLATGEPTGMLRGHTAEVLSVAWSPDGRLASASGDKTIILWNLAIGRPAQTLSGHTRAVFDVAWSRDGRLASGSDDGTVIIWDLAAGKPAQILAGHLSRVSGVAWSMDGHLASASLDGTVIIWNVVTGKPAQILNADNVKSVAWSADGRLASVTYDGKVIIWDLATGKPDQTLATGSNILAWSIDGKLASALNAKDEYTVKTWDLSKRKPAQTLIGHANAVNSVAWSPDGRTASGSDDGTVIIWNPVTGKPTQTLIEHTNAVNSVAWSPDGRLASSSWDGKVIIWDLANGKPSKILSGPSRAEREASSVAWSVDGRLASAAGDNAVIIWDLSTGKPAQTLIGSSIVMSVAWSTDGRLASGSDDGTVIIWDLSAGKSAQTLTLNTWNTLFTWGNINGVKNVAWSADGRLASASNNNTTIIWDLVHGKPAQTLTEHTKPVNSVAWSAEGQLASTSDDRTIRITRADLTGIEPCDWVFQNISAREWVFTQGLLYPYETTCPNVPVPKLPWWLTLQGHYIYFGLVLINIGMIWGIGRRIKRRVLFWITMMLLVMGSIIANILFLFWLWVS